MKLVTISGPRGAGKETILLRLLCAFPDVLHRVVPHTTRVPRPGEVNGREYHFVSEVEFDALIAEEQFVFINNQMAHQRSGTVRAELTGHPIAIIGITAAGARQIRKLVVQESGQVCSIFVYASHAERKRRIETRQSDLTPDEIHKMLQDDPVDPNRKHYPDFDLVVENPDGQLDTVVARILSTVEKFMRTGVEVT